MKEYAVEKHLVQKTRECGGICLKFISPGIAGVPDRIVILPCGKIGFAEMKAPGKKPRQLQKAVIRDLYRRRCRVATIDNLKSAEGFVRRLAK
nr:MAG TPA: Nuclease [Caudoviricetes sp.]